MPSSLVLPGRRARRGARSLGALGVAALLGVTACTEFWTGRPDVKRVSISVTPRTLAEGETGTAFGTAFDKNDHAISTTKRAVRFSSSNPQVAAVNSTSGQIVGVAPGVALIVAEAGGKSASDSVVVIQAAPASVETAPAFPIATIGSTPLRVTITPKNAQGQALTGRQITCATSNQFVATVTTSGSACTVVGVTPGDFTLILTINGKGFAIPSRVQQAVPATIAIALRKGGSSIQQGESAQIDPTLRDSTGAVISSVGRTIEWQSSDQTIATVSQTGIVTGQRPGSVTITAIAEGNRRATLQLQVSEPTVTQVFIGQRDPFVRLGVPRILSAVAADSLGKGTGRAVTWISRNESLLSVSQLGVLTARATGTTRIVAQVVNANGTIVADSVLVTITPIPISSIEVTPNQAFRYPGETVQYSARLFDSTGTVVTGRQITWISSDPRAVQIDAATGLATAVSPPGANVIAQVPTVPGFPGVTVQPVPLIVVLRDVARVLVNGVSSTSVTIAQGVRRSVAITAVDVNGNILNGRNIIWRSTDPNVAQADNTGTILGLNPGTTTITFLAVDATGQQQGTEATVTVTVSATR